MERSEGNMSLKNAVTLPGIDPETVRLVARFFKIPFHIFLATKPRTLTDLFHSGNTITVCVHVLCATYEG